MNKYIGDTHIRIYQEPDFATCYFINPLTISFPIALSLISFCVSSLCVSLFYFAICAHMFGSCSLFICTYCYRCILGPIYVIKDDTSR